MKKLKLTGHQIEKYGNLFEESPHSFVLAINISDDSLNSIDRLWPNDLVMQSSSLGFLSWTKALILSWTWKQKRQTWEERLGREHLKQEACHNASQLTCLIITDNLAKLPQNIRHFSVSPHWMFVLESTKKFQSPMRRTLTGTAGAFPIRKQQKGLKTRKAREALRWNRAHLSWIKH